jgi:hypothetical protein
MFQSKKIAKNSDLISDYEEITLEINKKENSHLDARFI